MKVLSLFDGMACGMLAFQKAGIKVENYDAYEIDEYAIKTATHNFPNIQQHGDVFKADFTQYKGVDFVIGGSPCTYWSIAQKNNRETEASGMGWELFSQYVRAIKEAEPKYFIYENNYSMSAAIRESINKAFGFEAIFINSALVSAQNRKRLYWVGKRNADGTYSKVDVKQPEDRGIPLKDILESGVVDREKAYALVASHQGNARDYFKKNHAQIVVEPVGVGYRNRREEDGKLYRRFETHGEEKANCITTVQTDSMVAEPIRVGALPRPNGELSQSQAFRIYDTNGKSVTINAGGGGAGGKTGLYAIPQKVGEIGNGGQGNRIYSVNGKSVAQTATSGGVGSNTGLYAIPTDKPIYEVKDGLITIKGKQYPIKLPDGYYNIRKLTVAECKRLQTVPEWYVFPVSNAQAYKMLGNGWTVDVIAHILSFIK